MLKTNSSLKFRKALFILISLFILTNSIKAKTPQNGYRGFLEWNTEVGWENNWGVSETYWLYGLSTSHGYQFNPHLFIGAGVWLQSSSEHVPWKISLPIFAQARTDWEFGKVPLFIDLKAGGVLNGRNSLDVPGNEKIFISPSFGYHLDWGRKVGANFSIGVSIFGYMNTNSHSGPYWKALPSVSFGIDF